MSGSKAKLGSKHTNLFKMLKNRIEMAWTGTALSSSPVTSPIKAWKEMEWSRKNNKSRTKAENIANMVRLRVVSGPEVNILFLGIPILIDCAASTIANNIKQGQQNRARAAQPVTPAAPAADKVYMKVKPRSCNSSSTAKPLPSAPYSDRISVLRDILVDCGMSEEGADDVVNGSVSDVDASEVLSKSDLKALGKYLAKDAEDQG